MRISTAHSFNASIETLQKRQAELSETQMQLTSGKRVNKASDDPVAAAQAERALALTGRANADQRTLDASRAATQLGESSVGNGIEILQQVRETLVAAGNGSYSDSERAALASKLVQLRDQLLSVANTSNGSGGFVFGGQGSTTPPFIDTPAGVKFVGQGGQTQASSGENLSLTIDGSRVWLQARSGNGVFNAAPTASNTGSGWITAGSVSNPGDLPYPTAPGVPSPQYSVEFSVTAGATSYSIFKDGVATPATNVPYVGGQGIDIDGMNFSISGNPAHGDSFALNEAANDLSVFDAMDEIITTLKQTNQTGSQVIQSVNHGLSNLNSLLGNLQLARSELGESLNRMDIIGSNIADTKLIAETARSNAEDLDLIEGYSKVQLQQTGYQSALQSYAMIQKLSMFNYISG